MSEPLYTLIGVRSFVYGRVLAIAWLCAAVAYIALSSCNIHCLPVVAANLGASVTI